MKSRTQKTVKYSLMAVLSVVLISSIILMLNPLRWPEKMLRQQLLRQTPVGTDIDEVIQYLESQDEWEIIYVNHTAGYHYFDGRPYEAGVGAEIGEQSIRVYLGEYRNPLAVDVNVFYAFDGDGKLMDAAIMKSIDSI
ncbi:MAG: hypothetical protein IJ496_01550 [Ruminococcus sp.]|nr:hypothetical protein [Ruminococcus sp.]